MKVKIKDIKANPNNPRVIKDEQFKKLVKSIQEFPEMLSVRKLVCTPDMVVLGGNMRLKALQSAGIKEVDVEIVDWDEQKQKEFIIKDNVSFGEWNHEQLANEWDAIELQEWGLELPVNVDVETLDAVDDEYEMPDVIHSDVVLGDLIEIGEHRLLCGDSTDSDAVAKLIGNMQIDLVFTDPMYNDGTSEIISIFELLNAKHFLLMATFKQCISFINDTKYNFRFDLVFNQKVQSSTMNKKVPYYLHKNIVYLTKDDSTIFNCDNAKGYFSDAGYYPSVIESSKNTHDSHGLTKNADGIKLILSGFKCKTIIDLFAGSGSTMLASHMLKRICYAVEIEPKYCQVIIDRMMKAFPELPVKINGKAYKK